MLIKTKWGRIFLLRQWTNNKDLLFILMMPLSLEKNSREWLEGSNRHLIEWQPWWREWLQDLKTILYLKRGKRICNAMNFLLVGKSRSLKGGGRSHSLGAIKSMDKTLSLKGGMRSHSVIMPRLVEEGKIIPISGLQPLVLAEHKLMSAKLWAKLTLAIHNQLLQAGVREGECPIKIIKLRESGNNLGSQKVFLTALVTMECKIGQEKACETYWILKEDPQIMPQ